MDNINKAFSETLDIINHLNLENYNKISKEFIRFISMNKDEKYKFNIDYSKNLNEQNILKDTRIILSIVYRDYLCSKEEKLCIIEEEKNKIKEDKLNKEIIKQKEYNVDNIFKNKTVIKKYDTTQETNIIKYKESFIRKLFNRILSFIK